jgi:hypothetical protein
VFLFVHGPATLFRDAMNLPASIQAVLARYDSARRPEILRRATARAESEKRPLTVLDIRLAALPADSGRAAATRSRKPRARSTARVAQNQNRTVREAPFRTDKPLARLPFEALPQLLKIEEAAEFLGLNWQQVADFRDTGEVKFINIAPDTRSRPTWRIPRASLIAFLESRQTTPRK